MSRLDRLANLLKEDVSEILRKKVSDPRIGFVSITDVDISPDLKNVKIFVSILGSEEEKNESMAGLKSATAFIRNILAERLEIRVIPDILFVRDNSFERGNRVLEIIKKNERENISNNQESHTTK